MAIEAYCGHISSVQRDKHGKPVILIVCPNTSIEKPERWDALFDEMLEQATDKREDWVYIFDTHLVLPEDLK